MTEGETGEERRGSGPGVGDRLELAVRALDPHGDGGARTPDGLVVFVEGGLPGDRVEATVTQRAARHARARLERLVERSPQRVAPPCPVVEACGGCPLMALAYPAQLEAKRRTVVDALARIGGLDGAEERVRPTLGMERPWSYRNKALHPVGRDEQGRPVVGFYRRGSHEVVPVSDCAVQHPTNVRLAAAARDAIEALGLPVYDEASGRGWVRHVLARAGEATGEALLVLVTASLEEPRPGVLADMAQRVRERVAELVGMVQNVNPRRTNVVLGPHNRLIWGRDRLYERVAGLTLELSATAFFQVNPRQAEVLYRAVRRRGEGFLASRGLPPGQGLLLDLYCGVGGIGLAAADLVERLVGVEEDPRAVADARRNAALNGGDHARFVVGPVEQVLPEEMAKRRAAAGGPVMVVVDPPRKGLDARVVETLARAAPDLVVYVSCNPATMARDLRQLLERTERAGSAYEWGPVQPVDLFPHTAHVEAVTHLVRRGGAR
ncbi:MAG: 23S rRNA (uracil(1939)-C(5))-methyltransferase RlmD [Firmicutes bacterium]|nr:23S rRNA (uracil(1939)-C(5))-methyltransferase RlmD [Bacillota bacterium]